MNKILVLIISIFISNFSYSERYDEMHAIFKNEQKYNKQKLEKQIKIEKARLDKIDNILKNKQKSEEQKALDDFLNKKKKH